MVEGKQAGKIFKYETGYSVSTEMEVTAEKEESDSAEKNHCERGGLE